MDVGWQSVCKPPTSGHRPQRITRGRAIYPGIDVTALPLQDEGGACTLGKAQANKTHLVTRHHEESRCGAPMGHGKCIHATGRAPPYTTGATNKYELGYKQSSVQARYALRAVWGRWEWSSDPDEGCQGGPRGYTTGLREILGFWWVRPGRAEGSDEYDPSETTT